MCSLLGSAGAGCLRGGASKPAPPGPRVISVTPDGRVERTEPIVIRFSEDAPEELLGRPRTIDEVALVQPRLSAVATFTDPRTLSIAPSEPFAPATRYRVSLRPDALGPGRYLVGRRNLSFRTAAFGLDDVRGWQSGDAIEIALRFSHPVRRTEVEAALGVTDPEGAPLFVLEERRPLASGGRETAPEPAVRRLGFRLRLVGTRIPDHVEVRIDAELASAAGGEPIGKPIRRRVPVEPEAPIIDQVRPVQLGGQWAVAIDLGSRVPPSRLVGAVRGAGPTVQMALSPDGPWILGAFSPETTASLQVGPPLLEGPRPWVVELPALEPALRILDPRPLLDLPPGARLAVEHHAVEGLVLSARAVPPELVGLVVDGLVPARPLPDAWSGPELGPIRRSTERNGKTPIDPSPLLDGMPPSLVLLEVRDEQRPWLRDVRYMNRRGLELVVKRRSGYLWASVQDLQGPVGGASVRALGVGGEVLDTARTDGSGVATLRWQGGVGALAVAEDGPRYAVLPLRGPHAIRGTDQPGLRATVVPDRAVLAPGQALEASVLLADARGRPVGGFLQARLRKERGGLAAKADFRVAARGAGSVRLELPEDAQPGRHVLGIHDTNGAALTEIMVEVRARRSRGPAVVVEVEEPGLAFRVRTEGLGRREGVHGTCHYRRLDTFAGLPPPPHPPPRMDPIPLDLGDGTERLVRCPEPPAATRPWSVRLEGHARDARSGEAARIFAPATRYAAIAVPEEPPMAGQPLEAQVRVVDSEGRPVDGAVDVVIRPLEPRPGARIRPGGRLVPEMLSVAGEPRTLTLALVDGAAVVPFVPPRGGPWSLRLEDAAERVLWVGGAPGTPRPLELVLHRVKQGVRAALPFPGRLLLAEEDLEVLGSRSTLETSVVSEHDIGRGNTAVTGLLLGTEGRWSAARLAPPEPEPEGAQVVLGVAERLEPGAPIDVAVRVRGPAWSGVFRALAVDAASAPSEASLRRWMGDAPALEPVLDTLVTAAFDAPAPEVRSLALENAGAPVVGRPGRAAVASPWFDLPSNGVSSVRLFWPDVSGRIRIMVLVRAGGRLGFGVEERVVGDGLGLDAVLPSSLRVGDRVLVPVLLENGSKRGLGVRVVPEGEGFSASAPPGELALAPGEVKEVRVLAEARESGPFVVSVGSARLERSVERIADDRPRWLGRGATAAYKSPAVLPTPQQLGARRAILVVGPSPLTRFVAALEGLLTEPPLDAVSAAATALAAGALPELARALGGQDALEAARARLAEGLSEPDPWVRAFVAHAILASETRERADAARQTLAEVAASASDPGAAAYARFLLARLGRSVPGSIPEGSSRLDVATLAAVSDILLGRADPAVLESLPLSPFQGARRGRYSPTLIDALALLALAALPQDVPAASQLEGAILGAARTSRWSHPAEEALALAALSAHVDRTRRRSYWGALLLDGEPAEKLNSTQPLVVSLDDRLSARPEVTVTGAGSAEVGLILAGETGPIPAEPLSVHTRRLDAEGGRLAGPILEGQLLVEVIEVENSSSELEEVVVDIPIPAGLHVETPPPKAVQRPGGFALVVEIPGGGTWSGRLEARARYAGVWQAPPVRARLRHDLAEAVAPREELRIDPR